MRLSWRLAWRFRQRKAQTGFVSFVSASSTMGIALGCAVMILMLSVMNGFERELSQRLLAVIPHGELTAVSPQGVEQWQQQAERIAEIPAVESVEPITNTTAMVQKGRHMRAIELKGLDPSHSGHHLSDFVEGAQWQAFSKESNRLLLGRGVADTLSVGLGEEVQLLLPQGGSQQGLSAPKSVWLKVEGIINIGGELDQRLAVMHRNTLSEALGVTNGAQGLALRFHDPFVAPQWVRRIGFDFPQHVYLSDWTRTQGHLYQDIQLVRMVVYLALTLLIAVACFNIVSSLVMAVNDKRGEIAMLKTMGASQGMIVRTFMLQGLLNGMVGTLVGVAVGTGLALYLPDAVLWLEQWSGYQLLSGDIYFVDFLPSELKGWDVIATALIATLLSVLATLYPAIKAARIQPAKVLGH